MTAPSLSVLVAALTLVGTDPAHAAERHRPIDGHRLLIRDDGTPGDRRIVVETRRAATLASDELADPRVLGATLEITGTGANAGTTRMIDLPPQGWRGAGRPPGRTGYRFLDPETHLSVSVRGDARSGRLRLRAKGPAVGYPLSGPQETLLVRLTIADDVHCAAFPPAALRRNGAGVVVARRSAAPASCALPHCGNGVLDPGEQCDDGNLAPRDGCSPTCRSESVTDPCRGVESAPSDRLGLEVVASGLDRPVDIAAPPGDPQRLWILEQAGRIRVVRDGTLVAAPVLNIVERVSCCGERGLLGIAFHPQYASNRLFFVNYTDRDGATVVARFRTGSDPDRAAAGEEQVLLRIPQDFQNHNGGQLAFGPDGYLYVGMGDGGAGGDPRERAQDPTSLLGKLLRIDVDVETAPYHAVPADNPRVAEGLPLGLIWANGLRNPWRFSFDRTTGDLLIADVGQGDWEELNYQPASSRGGENYGWDVFEGNACFHPPPLFPGCPAPRDGFVFPVHEYRNRPESGCSVTGGHVYRGCRMPSLHGTYFYSDFCRPFVRTFAMVDGAAVEHGDRTAELDPQGTLLSAVTTFGRDARGEILIATLGGTIYRIVPAPL